jgi:hypothetical protein
MGSESHLSHLRRRRSIRLGVCLSGLAAGILSCSSASNSGPDSGGGTPVSDGDGSAPGNGTVGGETGGSSSGGGSGSGSSGVSSSSGSSGAAGSSSSGGVSGVDAGATNPGRDAGTANPGTDGGVDAGTSASVTFSPNRGIITGVRGTTSPAAMQTLQLHNAGTTAIQVTGLSIGGTAQLMLTAAGAAVGATSTPIAGAPLFQIVNPPTFPTTLGAGMDLPVSVQVMTTGANLPAAPSNFNLGSTLLSATLTATLSTGTAREPLFGLVLIQANYESTLGQILVTLGYPLDVGQAQNNWNPNTSMMATTLPGFEANSDEVKAPLFVKSGTGNVTMTVAARFSPVGTLPFGWYPSGTTRCPTGCNTVGTMSMITDAQTSDKARMVYPPVSAGTSTTYTPGLTTTFDPGTTPFGLWINSDQATNKFNEGGNPVNGDYDYSEDALNVPAPGIHRIKSYPLKDATGAVVPRSYLVAVEEAANGDYQDYVFVLGNVAIAP